MTNKVIFIIHNQISPQIVRKFNTVSSVAYISLIFMQKPKQSFYENNEILLYARVETTVTFINKLRSIHPTED